MVPRRLGIKYSPPSLVVELSSEKGLEHFTIRLERLDKKMNAERLTYKLIARFPKYLEGVKTTQIQSLVERLLAGFAEPEVDLNKASAFQLQVAKDKMDVDFQRHNITRDQPDFVYDKQQVFVGEEDSGWDDE